MATLGLGIAANTAIFSLFYQVLLRSLPVRAPEQLMVFHSDPPNLPGTMDRDNNETAFSYPLYLRMRENRSLQGVAARSSMAVQMTVNGTAERGREEVVSGNFFDVLGLVAHVGRLLTPADDMVRGGNAVAVLSYDFWRRRFGGSASILNRTILLNGQPFTVIGVAPERFRGVRAGDSPDLFLPISMRGTLEPGWNGLDRPSYQWLTILGRLAPGVSRERATAELRTQFTTVMREHVDLAKVPQASRARLLAKRLELRPASQGLNSLEREWRRPLFVLLGMVLLLLVIGCANLANLLMARAVNRGREIAIRLALGAGRMRVMRLLMVESAVLALIGTVCGLLLSPVLARAIISLMPANALSGWLSVELNMPVLAFSIVLMATSTLLFGIAPAVQATSGAVSPLGERTQAASRGRVHARSRRILIAGQIALSLVLLCTAGLFGRSLANLMRHQPGFRADHLLSFSVDAGLGGYDTDRGQRLYRDLGRRLATLPGVVSASMAFAGPLSHSSSSSNVEVEGYTPHNEDEMICDKNAVGPAYFHTLGTAVLEGREFDERDRSGATKVAVVNQAFVKRFFGNSGAVGRKMEIGSGRALDIEIVGVVVDSDNLSLRETIKPTFYIPYEQSIEPGPRIRRGTFFVRANSGFDSLAATVRSTMAQLDGSLPVYALKPMQVNVDESIYTDRLIAALSTAFGLIALLLTAVGLYGVIAYLVGRRTAEIGIRMVLGAKPGGIIAMILGEVGMLVAMGGAAGIAGAIVAGRAVESQLFGMRGVDPMVLVAASGVLTMVAISAACIPAFRAARIQPLDALRHE